MLLAILALYWYYKPPAIADELTIAFNQKATEAFRKAKPLIENSLSEPQLVSLSQEVVGRRQGREAAYAIWVWISNNIKYSAEPAGADIFIPPMQTLAARAGDCEDRAILEATIAKIAGLEVKLAIARFVRISGLHMYALIEGYPCDPAPSEFGKEPLLEQRTHYAEVMI